MLAMFEIGLMRADGCQSVTFHVDVRLSAQLPLPIPSLFLNLLALPPYIHCCAVSLAFIPSITMSTTSYVFVYYTFEGPEHE